MNCIYCSAPDTKVIDSRLLEGTRIRRRRKCEGCSKRFTTFERVEISMPMVVKNDGRRENYQRQKLLGGIKIATQKLSNISMPQVDHIIDNIEKAILEISDREITTKKIGNLVMSYLVHLHPVAFIRFASVYRTFSGINDFIEELKKDIDNPIPEAKIFSELNNSKTPINSSNHNKQNKS